MVHTFLFLCVPFDLFFNWTFERNNVITLEIQIFSFPGVCCGFLCVSLLWALCVMGTSLRCKRSVVRSFLSLCLSLGLCGSVLGSPVYVVA